MDEEKIDKVTSYKTFIQVQFHLDLDSSKKYIRHLVHDLNLTWFLHIYFIQNRLSSRKTLFYLQHFLPSSLAIGSSSLQRIFALDLLRYLDLYISDIIRFRYVQIYFYISDITSLHVSRSFLLGYLDSNIFQLSVKLFRFKYISAFCQDIQIQIYFRYNVSPCQPELSATLPDPITCNWILRVTNKTSKIH